MLLLHVELIEQRDLFFRLGLEFLTFLLILLLWLLFLFYSLKILSLRFSIDCMTN